MQFKIEYGDLFGMKRTIVADASDPDRFGQNVAQDIEPIIERNKILAENLPARSVNKLVARVPMVIAERAMREKWDENDWKKFLNDPANEPFRVWKGRV